MTKVILAASVGLICVSLASSFSNGKENHLAMKNNNDIHEINIKVNEKFQEIDGFGASGAWSFDPIGSEWSEESKTKVADLLFSREEGIGLSMWRFNIGAGSTETDQDRIPDPWRRAESFKQTENGPYDWRKQAGQQWFLHAAKDRGVEQFIAFVNSPPVWMTKNGHAQPDAHVGTTNLKEDYMDEFSIYLADVLEHFEGEGLPFQYISPINEPTWDWNGAWQEGNRYSNEDMHNVIRSLYAELDRRGLDVEIDTPEAVEYTSLLDDDLYGDFTNSDNVYSGGNAGNPNLDGKYREYIKDFLGDPEISDMIGNKISAHAYWSDHHAGDDRLIRLREKVRENLDRYNSDARFWMSEYCVLGGHGHGHGRDLTMDTALDIARLIHFDMTVTQANAWQWWLALSPYDYKDGLLYTDYLEDGEESIIESKLLWAFGNYSRFVRPGAYRVELEGANDKDGLMGSAFYHDEDEQLSVVFVNHSDETKPVQMNVEDLPLPGNKQAIQFRPYVTSEDYDLERQKLFPAHKTFHVPPRSVVTFVAQ
jgi:O-glycosyl hydrolase